VHIEEVKLVEGEWRIAGASGVALVVCGTGPTMNQAQRQAHKRVRDVVIPYLWYRDDMGERGGVSGQQVDEALRFVQDRLGLG
jgi:phosphoribosylamine--glycine ligase